MVCGQASEDGAEGRAAWFQVGTPILFRALASCVPTAGQGRAWFWFSFYRNASHAPMMEYSISLLLLLKSEENLWSIWEVQRLMNARWVRRKTEQASQSGKKRRFIKGKTRGWPALEKNPCPPFLMGSFLYSTNGKSLRGWLIFSLQLGSGGHVAWGLESSGPVALRG